MADIRSALYSLFPDSVFSDLTPDLKQTDIYFADSIDTAPRDRLFAIIHMDSWATTPKNVMRRRHFSIWVHAPRRTWLDHKVTQNVLQRMSDILLATIHVAGSDGTLTQCWLEGMSGDLTDEGHQTIVNNASFNAGVK